MNNKQFSRLIMPLLASLLLTSPFAMADNHSPQMLAEMWVMTAKDGQAPSLMEAMKKYDADSRKLDNPRDWHMYTPVFGNHLNMIAVRSFGFSWPDMDSYQAWRTEHNMQQKWNTDVHQFVANYGHYLSVVDTENSHWGPEVKFRFVGVTNYKVKMGHWQAMEKDKKTLSDAAKAQKWPFNWEWAKSVSGESMLMLAVPYENWAAMAPPETTFTDVMTKHLGSEEEAKKVLERWTSHFEKTSYDLWARVE
ncbi:hypothetical protein [Aliiglaciecola litoralis]|uniref:Uncharacterized protein n=1 Tax=Aliiglaciecola litoralis TaxID=582857 RepID=A0ABN1LQA4_9ALTE